MVNIEPINLIAIDDCLLFSEMSEMSNCIRMILLIDCVYNIKIFFGQVLRMDEKSYVYYSLEY